MSIAIDNQQRLLFSLQASATGGLGSVKAEVMADTAVALASANVQVVSRKVIGRLDSVRHGVVLPLIIGELKQSRRQRQKRLALWAKQQLYTWIALFSRCLWRPLQDYDVKPPNATFRRGREHTMTNYPFSFWRWIKSIRIQLQEKSRTFDVLRGTNRHDWQFFFPTFSLPSSLRKLPNMYPNRSA